MDAMDRVLPYGYMAQGFHETLAYECPSAWKDAATYDGWLLSELARIATDAWPEWAGSMGWTGAARAHALDLTLADLALMDGLCTAQYGSPSRHADGKPHKCWFQREDALFFRWASRYNGAFKGCGVTPKEHRDAFIAGGDKVLSTRTSWWLKWKLQRPRPNQMAFFLQRQPPAVQLASSAWSPSAISGHAFQGLMGCLEIFRQHGPSGDRRLTAGGLRELALLATDIGDRRVYAGVHYPSDNAMSWRVALSFLERIGDAASRKFASDAIRNGTVYAAMKASAPHARCIAMVDELLT